MKKVLFLLPMLLLTACNGQKRQPETVVAIAHVNDGFQKFLDQFPDVSLPLEIKGCSEIKDLIILDQTTSSPFNKDGGQYAYGKFTVGKNHVAVITLSAADCFLPVLATYNLSGKLIDSEILAIGQCSDGPCYKCEEVLHISNDLTIHVADTMQKLECDEDDLPKGDPVTTTVIYKEGKIDKNGGIELSEEKEKLL